MAGVYLLISAFLSVCLTLNLSDWYECPYNSVHQVDKLCYVNHYGDIKVAGATLRTLTPGVKFGSGLTFGFSAMSILLALLVTLQYTRLTR